MERIVVVVIGALMLVGCAGAPVVKTVVVEKPIAIPCKVKLPDECLVAYSVDKVSPEDKPLTINRALRAEIEERAACQVKLLAALKGCDSTLPQ